MFFGFVSGFFCTTPFEVITLSFSWTPLEVGVGYRIGANACLGRTGVECGNTLGYSGGKYYNVHQFANIFGQLQLPLIVNHMCCWGNL